MAREVTTGWELGEAIEHTAITWSSSSEAVVQTDIVRTGTYALRMKTAGISPSGANAFTKTLSGNLQETYTRLALYIGVSSGSADLLQAFWALFDGASSQVALGFWPSDFKLRAVRGGTGEMGMTGGTLLDTGSVVLNTETWYLIEIYAKIADSGTLTVKVNGVTAIGFSGDTAATANEYATVIKGGGAGVGTSKGCDIYLDDWAVNGTAGSSQNSWVGTGGVYYRKGTADGSLLQWTPSAGTVHFEMIDDIPANDGDWVYSDDSGSVDIFDCDALDTDITSVQLVEVIFQASLAAAGSQNVQTVLRHNGTNYLGGTETVTSVTPSWVLYKSDPYYLEPGGTAVLARGTVDAFEVGVKIS